VSDLQVVPGATHLFEEPGTLRLAAELARDWFAQHFGAGTGSPVEHQRAPRGTFGPSGEPRWAR
jgi:hypothetical protein